MMNYKFELEPHWKKHGLIALVSLVSMLPLVHAQDEPTPATATKTETAQAEIQTWPPPMKGAVNDVATVSTPDFLVIPDAVKEALTKPGAAQFVMAKTAPTVDLVYHHPLPSVSANGTGWSAWGDIGVARDGRVYVGTGNHGRNDQLPQNGGGEALIYQYDPATKTLKQIADLNKTAGVQEGDPTWSKVHAGIHEGPDGRIYFTGTLNDGGRSFQTKWTERVPGGQLFAFDPKTNETKIVATFPGEVTPTTLIDFSHNVWYANMEGKTQHDDVALTAVDLATGKVIYQSPHDAVTGSRNFMLARDGAVYFNGRGGIWKYNPTTKTIAPTNSEFPPSSGQLALNAASIKDLAAFTARLKTPNDALSRYLREQLSPATVQLIDNPETNKRLQRAYNQKLGAALADDLNRALQSNTFYDTSRFRQPLSPYLQRLRRLGAGEVARFNRALISETFPAEIAGTPNITMRASTLESRNGYIYGATARPGKLFRYTPAQDKLEMIGPDFLMGDYTTVTVLSPDEKYVYYLPGAHGGASAIGTPVVQYNIATGQRKVLAFLKDGIEKATGYSPAGTYGVKISPDGSTLYVGFNGNITDETIRPKRHAKNFGLTSLAAIHIPASER